MRCCFRRKFPILRCLKFCNCYTINIPLPINSYIMLQALHFFAKHVIGKILFVVVFSLLAFNIFVAITIVVPYELLHKPPWAMAIVVLLAIYFCINIYFHYFMACFTNPGSPAKNESLPRCNFCQNHKPMRAHHCSICNICVLNMDHHCIWLGQCVGAKNHRYFFQFIVFAPIAAGIYVFIAFNAFYYNYWNAFTNQAFCNADLELLPWFNLYCDDGGRFISGCIFFTYFFCLIILITIGGFALFHFLLISVGETTISMLQYECGNWFAILIGNNPFRHTEFRQNWQRFLGLDHQRSFFKCVLFPSTHTTYYANQFDDEPLTAVVVV